MEEYVQERTEYRNRRLLCSFAVKELLGFRTAEMPGEHARGTFRILLPEDAAWDTVSFTESVQLCEPETVQDVTIATFVGAVTGAIGAKWPGMNCFVSGGVDAGAGVLTRGLYAFTDPDMAWEDKLAYMFDPKQILADFVTGTIIKGAFDWINWRIQNARGGSRTLQTGGRQGDLTAYIKRLETIDLEYENIRIDTTDIPRIAQNTGMPEWKISRIKEHVFFNEHILEDGVRRYDPDSDIADAWYRLINGTHNQNDIDLLNHEYFEAKVESFFKTDYRTAHDMTLKSGRIWDPYKEVN